MPDQPIAWSSCLGRAGFLFADDRYHFVRPEDARETFTRAGGENLLRILQDAGAADDPSARNVDLHVEASEVVVELRGTEVHAGVPAAQIIVFRDTWEPLRRLKERVIPPLSHAVAAAPGAAGKFRPPSDLELRDRLGGHRLRQREAGEGLVET